MLSTLRRVICAAWCWFEEPRAMGVGGAPRAVGGRVAGSPLREAEGIHPAIGHYAR